MLLTIIVPIYNKEALLRQCLDSFAAKDFVGRLEVLAIDDGSKDNSLAVALEYNKKYPEIYKVIPKKNGGVGSVMNIGIQHAVGKYIKEVDADDYVYTDGLRSLLTFLEQCDTDLVLTHFQEINEAGEYLRSHYMTRIEYGKEYFLEEILNAVEIYIPTLTVRREMLTEHNFLFEETRYYVDMQLIGDCIYYASTCMVLNNLLYCYRVNQEEQSVSLKSYIKNQLSFRRQTELSLERFCHAQMENLLDIKKSKCKAMASLYSSMLYIIYLMDKSQESNARCRELDSLLEKRYPEIYFEVGKHALVRELRNESFRNIEIYKAKVAKTIEEVQSIGKGNISLGELCSLELDSGDSLVLYKLQKQRDKQSLYLRLLNKWLMNYQHGIRIENYLLNQGFHKIAIYGCGMLGERLYQELADSKIYVAYGIDQKGIAISPNLQTYTLQDFVEEVDGIIISVISEFSAIRRSLRQKVTCPIISLEDVIYRS